MCKERSVVVRKFMIQIQTNVFLKKVKKIKKKKQNGEYIWKDGKLVPKQEKKQNQQKKPISKKTDRLLGSR